MIDWDSLENFTADEFKCRCCGIEEMNAKTMLNLQELRTAAGFPFVITSGYRCPQHNANVSSTGLLGPHTTGQAVDIACRGIEARTLIVMHDAFGFTGLGVKQKGDGRFIHLDDLREPAHSPRPWVWSY